jgi:hypothetical protein
MINAGAGAGVVGKPKKEKGDLTDHIRIIYFGLSQGSGLCDLGDDARGGFWSEVVQEEEVVVVVLELLMMMMEGGGKRGGLSS